jgi:hypothetical protein
LRQYILLRLQKQTGPIKRLAIQSVKSAGGIRNYLLGARFINLIGKRK